MYDYGDLVYLDVPKTGSSFVMVFLRDCCTLEMRPSRHHKRIEGEYNRDAYYFITVRDPIAQYMSLFRYGVDGNGAVYGRMKAARREAIYARGFEAWLEFVLDDRNAGLLGEGFGKMRGTGLGFMTFRFVALSIADPMDHLPAARSIGDVRQVYAQRNLARRVIRNEALNEGLRALAFEDAPHWFNLDAAAAFLAQSGRVNASRTAPPQLPRADLLAELRRREAFLYDNFYPDAGGRQ